MCAIWLCLYSIWHTVDIEINMRLLPYYFSEKKVRRQRQRQKKRKKLRNDDGFFVLEFFFYIKIHVWRRRRAIQFSVRIAFYVVVLAHKMTMTLRITLWVNGLLVQAICDTNLNERVRERDREQCLTVEFKSVSI